VHGATPCTTLGVPEFSQGRAYGDSLGAALGGRAAACGFSFPLSSPRGRGREGAPQDPSALGPPRRLPEGPELTRKFRYLPV
jgi:hypothetical protein